MKPHTLEHIEIKPVSRARLAYLSGQSERLKRASLIDTLLGRIIQHTPPAQAGGSL